MVCEYEKQLDTQLKESCTALQLVTQKFSTSISGMDDKLNVMLSEMTKIGAELATISRHVTTQQEKIRSHDDAIKDAIRDINLLGTKVNDDRVKEAGRTARFNTIIAAVGVVIPAATMAIGWLVKDFMGR